MGQYYKIVNLTKKQYLTPHTFGDGAKLMEFGCSGSGVMTALALLLADGNNRGGGDMRSDDVIIGSWEGDRIVITGDYADAGKFTRHKEKNLYEVVSEAYKDVSEKVLLVMAEDSYLKEDLRKSLDWNKNSLGPDVYKAIYGKEKPK